MCYPEKFPSCDQMKLYELFFVFIVVLLNRVVIMDSFNIPPKGMCWVEKNGDCMRCDCKKPLKCYRGTCR
ncbi:hypothetical protein KIN20_012552 [Parelaphostrongylus tenuis]|uniref:Uncharacterized protein n=1 Tax=Parelaphostrongylus tenuis TaxID=148309 RepID=A0AAD5QKD5_PARTN|nr:hypothetical protein KIN20_012552 [Parelaphostrongylus tenuis]